MPKARVYELAKECNLSSRTVLTILADLGEFVRSASSTIEAPVAQRLRTEIGRRTPARNPFRPLRPGFGRPVARNPPRQPPPRGSGSIRVPTLVEEAAALRSLRRNGPPAEREIDVRWAERMFEPTEIRQWRAAGLGHYDYGLAEQCRGAGLTPEDLARVVDGTRVALRLTGGESAVAVRSRLRDQASRRAS